MLTFLTARPKALLSAFQKAIEDGDITTWDEDSEGDFTHLASQWTKRAWMRPEVVVGTSLRFAIVFRKNETDRRLVYAYYHGHLLETFLNHFADQFTKAEASPNPTGADASI